MTSEILDISSIKSFAPIYPVSAIDISEMSCENIAMDLDGEKILNNELYEKCIHDCNNNTTSLGENSNDDINDFLLEFLEINPQRSQEYNSNMVDNSNEDPLENVESEVVTIDTGSTQATQHINISQTPSEPGLHNFPLIVIPKSTSCLNFTPLTSRQLRYRSLPPQDCDICGKTFRARQHLRRHRLEKHSELSRENFAYPCQQCDKRFKRREHLQIHERTKHSNIKDYKCETCGKQFVRKSQLKRHMGHHERSKTLSMCIGCGRVFARSGNLVKHVTNGCLGMRGPGGR